MFSFGDLMSQNVERQGNIIESNFFRYCQFPAMFLHWSVIQQRSRWRQIHSQRSTLRNPFDSYTNIHNRIFISSECYIHNRIFSQRDIPRKAVTGSTERSRRVSQKWFTKFASKRSRLNCKNRRDAAGCYVRSSSRGGPFSWIGSFLCVALPVRKWQWLGRWNSKLLRARTVRDGRRSAWSRIFPSGAERLSTPGHQFIWTFTVDFDRVFREPRSERKKENRTKGTGRLDSAEHSAPIDETVASSDVVIGRNQESPLGLAVWRNFESGGRLLRGTNLSRVRPCGSLDLWYFTRVWVTARAAIR